MGLHKWSIRFVFNVPIMTCSRCGYYVPKPTAEKTASKHEVVRDIQKEMDKQKPILPSVPVSPDIMKKAKEKLILKAFEEYQKYKKSPTGKLKYVGDRT